MFIPFMKGWKKVPETKSKLVSLDLFSKISKTLML